MLSLRALNRIGFMVNPDINYSGCVNLQFIYLSLVPKLCLGTDVEEETPFLNVLLFPFSTDNMMLCYPATRAQSWAQSRAA